MVVQWVFSIFPWVFHVFPTVLAATPRRLRQPRAVRRYAKAPLGRGPRPSRWHRCGRSRRPWRRSRDRKVTNTCSDGPTNSSFNAGWCTYPSEKYEFVSWDDDVPNKWKVIKLMFQTTNQNGFIVIHDLGMLRKIGDFMILPKDLFEGDLSIQFAMQCR